MPHEAPAPAPEPPRVRSYSGWILHPYRSEAYVVVESQIEIDEELWLAIRHPAEVMDAGLKPLRKRVPARNERTEAELEPVWREFRAYIRQAENFYRGAKVLHWTSAPLNYYYAFLNLAKAWCVLADRLPPRPSGKPRALRHGMSGHVVLGPPDIWRVTSAKGVLPMFYQLAVGQAIGKGIDLNAHDLLGYCPSIQWQLEESGHQELIRSFPMRRVALTTPIELWDVLLVLSRTDLMDVETFSQRYEELSASAAKDLAYVVFGMHAPGLQECRVYQRRQPFVSPEPGRHRFRLLDDSIQQALPSSVFPFTAHGDAEAMICLPYGVGATAVSMNEQIAIYVAMFFLSTLVRYHPDYMETIASSTNAWLVESFVKSAPLAFLRHMISSLLGYSLVMRRR